MNNLQVLSHFQAEQLCLTRERGEFSAVISTDLNRSSEPVTLDQAGVHFKNGESLSWELVDEIRGAKNNCFLVRGSKITKIQAFSSEFNRVYVLMPTSSAPTFLISGIPMHRIKDTDPYQDTLQKMKAAKPVTGQVLDTATGLGYTAIEASHTAEEVTTIELDPHVLEIARLNPWSQELFDNPKIKQHTGSSFEIVPEFANASFSLVIHDPPMFSLAGDLYSAGFYRELYRVLSRKGRLLHYIGDLDSPSGRRTARGAARRLVEAGFSRVVERPAAFALLAYKAK